MSEIKQLSVLVHRRTVQSRLLVENDGIDLLTSIAHFLVGNRF